MPCGETFKRKSTPDYTMEEWYELKDKVQKKLQDLEEEADELRKIVLEECCK